jgi:hypothetical protein
MRISFSSGGHFGELGVIVNAVRDDDSLTKGNSIKVIIR